MADELITSRAGVRVCIGNTDAEGRMVMADVLCHMKERVRSSTLCLSVSRSVGNIQVWKVEKLLDLNIMNFDSLQNNFYKCIMSKPDFWRKNIQAPLYFILLYFAVGKEQ